MNVEQSAPDSCAQAHQKSSGAAVSLIFEVTGQAKLPFE
jgi:hypothetical protein